MKFKFAFEKLLEIRRRKEDLAKRDRALAARAVDEANAELRAMYEAIDRARERAAELERGKDASAAPIAMIDDFIRGQGVRIEVQRGKIRELLAAAESAQEALVEAARDRKTLEKLRERRWNERREAARKLEQRRIDDLTTMRHARAARSSE